MGERVDHRLDGVGVGARVDELRRDKALTELLDLCGFLGRARGVDVDGGPGAWTIEERLEKSKFHDLPQAWEGDYYQITTTCPKCPAESSKLRRARATTRSWTRTADGRRTWRGQAVVAARNGSYCERVGALLR